MFGAAKTQSGVKPTAYSTLLQSSCYGSAIPTIYGMTQSNLMAIWAADLRQARLSSKKLKNFLKKTTPSYVENIDFLIGHNPITGVMQVWNNGSLYPLELATATFDIAFGSTNTYTIDDDDFYAIIAVSATVQYSLDVDDYGSNGPQTLSGTMEVPFWNQLETGPDISDPGGYRYYPGTFRWAPSYGATFYLDNTWSIQTGGTYPAGDLYSSFTGTMTVYYYKMTAATSNQPPITRNWLAFENELGNGDEYANFPDQQITYPQFAGAGSSEFDLGTTATLPALQVEVKAKWGFNPTGDCDFADIIEDIVKSGISQAAVDSSTSAFTQLEHGVSSRTFPGPVQKKIYSGFEYGSVGSLTYDLPNTAGNTLLFLIDTDASSPSAVTDTNGNTWTQLGTGSRSDTREFTWTLLACVGCAAGPNTITFTNNGFYAQSLILMELSGVDTFDGIDTSVGINASCSLTTTNSPGFAEILLAFSLQVGSNDPGSTLQWPTVIYPGVFGGDHDGGVFVQQRNVKNPGEYSLSWSGTSSEADAYMIMVGFKSTQPATYPNPYPDFLDKDSLDTVRAQCRANGLWGSLTMNSQQSASDWLKTLYQAANAAPVFLGFGLYSYPYSEVSTIGHGIKYISPTASGPLANLSDLNGDYIEDGGGSDQNIVEVATVDRTALPNVLQMQCYDRSSNYNQVVISQPESASIALYGVRKADPIINAAVQDSSVARALLGIQVRRNQYGGDVYSFPMSSKYDWLSPMDLITVTDTLAGINAVPVRITSMEENESGSWSVTAEPFVYGMSAPVPLSVTSPTNNPNDTTASAGDVNTPVIFEPPSRLTGGQSQIWLGISSSADNFGGAIVFISTDGGASYPNNVGTVNGSATTGVTTSDWPANADPDTTNDLPLDLTESLGELSDYSTADESNFTAPCYVDGGAGDIPYELMAYGTATLTATNKYTLKATGSGNQLRRSVFGCPTPGEGVDHPSGSRFMWLDPAGQGILKINLPSQWVGTTLYIKILSFNTYGGGAQTLADATAYTYTPTGVALASSTNSLQYTQNPATALTQPSSTSIDMSGVTVSFLSNTVNYNARTFTITAPSVPTWYYVTIADPGYLGDVGSSTSLTAYCETSDSKVGQAGYTFIGAILALPAGSATTILPGGWPEQQLFLINGS